MLIAHPRAGLIVGLVIETLLVAIAVIAFVVFRRAGQLVGTAVLAAVLWGGLIAASYAFMVRIHADARGVRGHSGFRRFDLRWVDIAAIAPIERAQKLRIELRDGDILAFSVPGWSPREAAEILQELHEGKLVRVVESSQQTPYRIPPGIETHLALEHTATELRCVNVMINGDNIKDVAEASRVLLVRAADEHRWDPRFGGAITLLVSPRTPSSPELARLMDAAVEGARHEVRARGWSVVGGAPFELSWKRLG